ncbi:hypothetical protein [Corynebacterium heidelbergense]|uniref:Uncharacterized protein n=1 Tax=Corynebacterium heidelbergense TaxID=2055947 RepID=A0A364V5B8_9CORY|nr:hypothetical protein [Corynebacterium heidelbergense]RAV31819.1 hypothetical protein DLJ54_06445 [Corynebacterium heidelbergense]
MSFNEYAPTTEPRPTGDQPRPRVIHLATNPIDVLYHGATHFHTYCGEAIPNAKALAYRGAPGLHTIDGRHPRRKRVNVHCQLCTTMQQLDAATGWEAEH